MNIVIRILLVVAAAALGADAQISYIVPVQFPTIQSAIDAAVDGDIIIINPGTYSLPIVVNNKSISLCSSAGAAATVLDGQNVRSVVTVGGIINSLLIDGFTIQNGRAEDALGSLFGINFSQSRGGGISIGPFTSIGLIDVRHCIIQSNLANLGGGICAQTGTASQSPGVVRISDSSFINNNLNSGPTGYNVVMHGFGAIAIIAPVSLEILRCSFVGNGFGIAGFGGAVGMDTGGGTLGFSLSSSTFDSNNMFDVTCFGVASSPGVMQSIIADTSFNGTNCGVKVSMCIVQDCSFDGTTSVAFSANSSTNCRLERSMITNCAVGARIETSLNLGLPPGAATSSIRNCEITGCGVGIEVVAPASATVVNPTTVPIVSSCTIADNNVLFPGASGVGIAVNSPVGVLIENTILTGHAVGTMAFSNPSYAAATVVNGCNIQGGWSGAGTGNFDLAPQFVDPPNDYHLLAASPCVDAGFGNPAPGSLDVDGEPRVLHGGLDVGADEFLVSGSPGTVGAGLGATTRVLTVNGSAGTYGGLVDVALNESLTIALAQPSSHPTPSAFVIWMLGGIPAPIDTVPSIYGTLAFLPYHADPQAAASVVLANSYYSDPNAYAPPTGPAPFVLTHPGLPFPFTVTLHGLVDDTGPAGSAPATTNAIVLRVQ